MGWLLFGGAVLVPFHSKLLVNSVILCFWYSFCDYHWSSWEYCGCMDKIIYWNSEIKFLVDKILVLRKCLIKLWRWWCQLEAPNKINEWWENLTSLNVDALKYILKEITELIGPPQGTTNSNILLSFHSRF